MPQLPSSSFSYTTIFNKAVSPKGVQIRDTTDYATIIIDPATVFIYLKVTFTNSAGTTVIYNNFGGATPDLTRSMGDTSTSAIPLPLQTDGNIAFGDYTIEAQYDYLDAFSNPFTTFKSYAYTYSWCPPIVSIMYRINLLGSNITTTDTTAYGPYETFTRAHTISPPNNAQLPPLSMATQTTTLAINVYQNIATGTWGTKVVSDVTYLLSAYTGLNSEGVQTGGFLVVEQLIGCIEFSVVSDLDINALMCCLTDTKAEYERLLINGPAAKAQQMYNQIIAPLELNLVFYFAAISGGCVEDAALLIERITQISGCGNCACGGDECPTPIPVISSTGNFYNVDSPNGSILVVPEIVGSTTTFHITVNPANIPTVPIYTAIGSGSINVATTTPVPGTVLFTVSSTTPISAVENAAVVKVIIEKITGTWTIRMEEIFVDTSSGIVNPFADSSIAWAIGSAVTDFAAFLYSDFFGDGLGTNVPQKFVAFAQSNNVFFDEDSSSVIPYIGVLDTIECNIVWCESDVNEEGNKMVVRLYNPVASKILTINDLESTGRTRFEFAVRVQAVTV